MASNLQARSLQPGDVLVVVHDFDARSADELTLRKSERIELIELDDGFGDGWYLGNHLSTMQTGLFPGVYTTKATAPPPRSLPHSRSTSGTTHQATTVTSSPQPASVGASPRLSQPQQPVAELDTTVASQSSHLTDSPVPESPRSSPAAHHTTYVQRSIGEALKGDEHGEDSPVMNQTLSVIDEHIENLSTPRQSLAAPNHKGEDSESEYSSRLERHSYMAGPETDEEDNGDMDEATVRSWDHTQTAAHLRNIGVDPKHCDIFEEQEISGDVLLDMDQSFIYMKEYDFGVMGRRLKTWHKVRDFQQAVKSSGKQRTRSSEPDQTPLAHQRMPSLTLRQHNDTPPITEEDSDMPHPLQPGAGLKRMSWNAGTPPIAWRASVTPDSPNRSTSMQRQSSNHSQTGGSFDFGKHPDLELSSVPSISSHNKQSSMDHSWSMTGSNSATTPASSLKPPRKQDSLDNSPALSGLSPVDIDRGYFSGNEVDNRKSRRLSKKDTPSHTRQSSLMEQSSKRLSAMKRHSRLSSVDSVHDVPPPGTSSSMLYNLKSAKGRFRSASTRAPNTRSMIVNSSPPTVTNLEEEAATLVSQDKLRMQDRARRLMGFRATSEAVTPTEKQVAKEAAEPARIDTITSPTPTGSDTPSLNSKSIDTDTPEPSLKAVDSVTALPIPPKASRTRPKGKMRTSAYTHGLLNITPAQAKETADYSGWMKKKASGIMTTWKPRLFILRGKRLSYYYADSDTTERGIIDISGHKVLVANNDPITTLHATVTGASKPSPSQSSSDKSTSKLTEPGAFFFKLVPPKTGTARAVQFTKPTTHYFQVDNAIIGRKWMGEIMKATIEHDLTTFETTNRQKTISLAKARARRERPPALDDTKALGPNGAGEKESTGLNISGLEYQDSGTGLSTPAQPDTIAGAEAGNGDEGGGESPADEPELSVSTSPKALAMLGLAPSLSQRSKHSNKKDELDEISLATDELEHQEGEGDTEAAANVENKDEVPPAVPAKD